MTIQEASKEYQYDVSMYWCDDDELWHWDINGGYSSCGSHKGFENPNDCRDELVEYLKTFNGFDK